MKVTVIPGVVGAFGKVPQRPEKVTRQTGDKSKNGDPPDHSTVKIGRDILKNPEEQWRKLWT